MSKILEVKDLDLEFKTSRGILKALNGISFDIKSGEIFGIVGESGCGKTVTGLSVLNLLPRSASITNGSIKFNETDLRELPKKEMDQMDQTSKKKKFRNQLKIDFIFIYKKKKKKKKIKK